MQSEKVRQGVCYAVLLSLSACGGGDSGDISEASSLKPILAVGMQRQYVGTATRAIFYADPTAELPNNTLVYASTETQNVLQAPSNASASFDVQSEYVYTVQQDPGVGTVPISQSVDNYENLDVSGGSQMTTTVGQKAVVVSNYATSNALGGGPYTQTTTTDSTFPTARDSFSYPLQSGAPPNVSNLGFTRTRTENDDGSFSYQTAYVNDSSLDLTQASTGGGTYTSTAATATTSTTLDLPVTVSGVSTLPVMRSTVITATGATTDKSYTAANWYPSSGAPNSPLVLQVETVLGLVSSLPAQCEGAVLRADIYEIDTTSTSQVTISPSYSVTEVSTAYELLTGPLTSTTTTDTTTLLSAINY